MFTTSSNACRTSSGDSAMASAALERRRLVHGLAAALLAAHEVLRIVLRGLDVAAAGLGVRGDLALDHARRVALAVRAPHDLVALLELFGHAAGLPERARKMQKSARARRPGHPPHTSRVLAIALALSGPLTNWQRGGRCIPPCRS